MLVLCAVRVLEARNASTERRTLPRHKKSTACAVLFTLLGLELLLAAARIRGRIGGHVLRGGHVSAHGILVHGVDHNFKQVALAAGIKLERFVNVAIFLFDLL